MAKNELMLLGLIKSHERFVGKLDMIEEIRKSLIDLDISINDLKKVRIKLDSLKEDKLKMKATVYEKLRHAQGK